MNRSKSNKKMSHQAKKQRALRNEARGRTKTFIKAKQWEKKHVLKEKPERKPRDKSDDDLARFAGFFFSGHRRVEVKGKKRG